MRLTNLIYYKSEMPTSYLPKHKSCGPMFDNPELNRLVDAHHRLIQDKGYEKLLIPSELHKIDPCMMSEHDRYVSDTLIKNGFKAYLCGGTARDMVLNDKINDFDFVTDANNEELSRLFENIRFNVIPTGHQFGYINFGDEVIDICTMVNIPAEFYGLKNVPAFDPTLLYSNNLLFDALQRDLKLNTLYYDTQTGELVDWFGALYDLREGIISSPSPTYEHLQYDHRVVLRALRFKARFGFELSEDLEKAIRKYGFELTCKLTPGAMADNLPAFFSAGYSYTGTCLLLEYDLLGAFFPLLGSSVDSSAYREYVKRTAYAVDWIFDEGAVGLPLLAMAAFLWPVVRKLKNRGTENPEEVVLKSQREIMTMSDEEASFMLKALHIEEVNDEQAILNKMEEVFEKPTLEDALGVLRIHYWRHPFELE